MGAAGRVGRVLASLVESLASKIHACEPQVAHLMVLRTDLTRSFIRWKIYQNLNRRAPKPQIISTCYRSRQKNCASRVKLGLAVIHLPPSSLAVAESACSPPHQWVKCKHSKATCSKLVPCFIYREALGTTSC